MKNVLLIASFGSGSTYFQRAATFWIRELIQPDFVNPHELLNGIGVGEQGYLIKKWADVNAQSFDELSGLLSSSADPVLVRLAYDHWLNRRETKSQQELFTEYLRNNFTVFGSIRDDIFDYALSYAVRRCTDRPASQQINNVHSAKDRVRLYGDKRFEVDTDIVVQQSQRYLDYRNWLSHTFPGFVPLLYEELSSDIDAVLCRYFPAQQTIKQKYGISIAEYTQYHYEISKNIDTEFDAHMISAVEAIDNTLSIMCSDQVMLDTIPIKSTTPMDKRQIVINFVQCVDAYNRWARDNNLPDYLEN